MTEVVIRRVVLTLDSAERTSQVVAEAVRVASRLGAELEGLLVEDDELLRLAGSAFGRRFTGQGAERRFEAADLEREWRVLARDLSRALEQEAQRHHVPARFEVTRARADQAVRQRLARGDLVVVGWGGWSPRAYRTAPVRVIWDGSEASERALQIGARLAGSEGQLAVWMCSPKEGRADGAQRISADLGARVGRLRLSGLEDPTPAALRQLLAQEPGGLLVVPAGTPVAVALGQRSVSARFPAGVLVVQ